MDIQIPRYTEVGDFVIIADKLDKTYYRVGAKFIGARFANENHERKVYTESESPEAVRAVAIAVMKRIEEIKNILANGGGLESTTTLATIEIVDESASVPVATPAPVAAPVAAPTPAPVAVPVVASVPAPVATPAPRLFMGAIPAGMAKQKTSKTPMTPIDERSKTYYATILSTGQRRECWGATSKDGRWRYERLEETGTPWAVVGPDGAWSTTYGTLAEARRATYKVESRSE